jgi:hypothetical protein
MIRSMNKNGWGGKRKGAGRTPRPLMERQPRRGKISIQISHESAVQLSNLMLRQVDGVHTPEDMLEHLIRQELERTS